MDQDSVAAAEAPAPAASPKKTPQGSCPFLGRRQHPDQPYTYATSHNVCFARRRGEDRAYTHVHRRYQAGVCLEPSGGWPTCRFFRRAMEQGISPPRPLPTDAGMVVQRVRRRRRRRNLWQRISPTMRRALAALFLLALSAAVGWTLAKFTSGGG